MTPLRWSSLAFLSTPLLLGACATTHISSEMDPALGSEPYSVVMVAVALPNIHERQILETSCVEAMQQQGYSAHGISEFLFGHREYDEEERAAIYRDHGVEAVLLVSELGYAPSSEQRSFLLLDPSSDGSGSDAPGSGSADPAEAPQLVSVSHRPQGTIPLRIVYVGELYDLRSGDLVWYAEADVKRGISIGGEDLAELAARALARQLVKDELLVRGGQPSGFHALNTVD